MPSKPVVYHIPVCPFCQRLEILLELKGCRGEVDFQVVDITKPRDPALLEKTRGRTALPVLETEDGDILWESLVLLRYLDERFGEPRVRAADPREHAIEGMVTALEGPLTAAGYTLVMNQDPAQRGALTEKLVGAYAALDKLLRVHAPDTDFLFGRFGWAEAVFTPLFMRFWFLDYYEGFELPPDLARVARWRDACLAHPAAQQTSREEIVKVYYDYAKGAGNGAPLPGRSVSSFAFTPHWRERPWPPQDKYGVSASDVELGLVPAS